MDDDTRAASPIGAIEPNEQPERLAHPVTSEHAPRLPFSVVGIGASAGGLEAFSALFSAMPNDSGMAFVLIQHLPPDRESMLADILQRCTSMPVSEVEQGILVQPNRVYVIRPGHTLTIKEGRLRLGERVERPRHSRPVDDFFKSLAEEQRERAICVIMSGMGSNGTAGAQAIKAVGGLCIAQEPESAQFPSMPRHLIDAGYADLILPPAEIPEALVAYSHHPYANAEHGGELESKEIGVPSSDAADTFQREQQQVREILAIIKTRTRFDFSGYKKPTVLRRIQRRMGLNRVTELGAYAKVLRQSSVEVSGLADDLLIHVTGFFRDPEAWETLRQRVIVPLVRAREPEASIRCWVAACSSGEEAYSLAMLLIEESERAGKRLNIKVFATDTAERTLSNARNGAYPGGIESDISPERLQRFFDRDDAIYRVRQDLRERVVFAPQNVLSDPPFSRLDIVTCRNLLIYLEPEVQLRVFSLVHFGLREGGVLFLGSSETVPAGAGTFEPIDKKARIYKRVGTSRHGSLEFSMSRPHGRDAGEVSLSPTHAVGPAPSLAQLTARALLALHVQAAVTVDRNYRVVYYQGDTKPYLGQPSGEPTQDALVLANEEVRGAMRMALQRSMASNSVERASEGWVTHADGLRHRVLVTASPLVGGEVADLFVVSFQQRADPGPLPSETAPDVVGSHQSGEELQRLRDELQSAMEELQASNEEHKAAAEEAMSMNEELQSSNEELETSKEEMQSLNEELSTVNAQLHAKMEELQRTTGDLRSLLASTDIAVIFLDNQFRIRRYTPAARKLLELIGSDVGRPLNDLAKKFTDPDLMEDLQFVLHHLAPAEREVRSNDGRWYARRVLPYRTSEDRIEGVVITFVDISDRIRAHHLMTKSAEASSAQKLSRGPYPITSLLTDSTEAQGVLEEILSAALDLHSTTQGDLRLYDSASQNLQLVAHRGISADFVGAWETVSLSEEGSAVRRAVREQRPVVIDDIERELAETPLGASWLKLGVRAIQCVPLLTRVGQVLGVMTLYFRSPQQSDGRSLRITELLAGLAAGAVERLRIEDERAHLLRNEQLARRALDDAARMKDDFLAMLSHELRTPLSAILLWGKILRNGPVAPADLSKGLEAILSSADAQSRLIEDLLDSSGAAVGKLQLDLSDTDLVEIVQSVIEQNDPACKAKNLRLELQLSADVGHVMADATRIRQVVWNLLMNAIKFTPEGGEISVSLTRSGDEVTCSVKDSGVGITADFLPYMFDRFRQYEASITRKHGGLGLGLTISKQLVEMHGGTIHAESAGPGLGATFVVTLPMPPAGRRSGNVSEHKSTPGAGELLTDKAILLVEDDPQTQKALALLLRQAGASVAVASNATEALEAYAGLQPQIVLSDIGLPDLDGYTLLGRIRAFEREHRIAPAPAVALTAYTRSEDTRKATEAGFALQLAKPIDPQDLVMALSKLTPTS